MKVALNRRGRAIRRRAYALTAGRDYIVIGIEAGDYRIVDDTQSPYLYPNGWFAIVDPEEPTFWVTSYGDDGERYAYPPELNEPGFFEDYFDGDAAARAKFWLVADGRYGLRQH
jgi:hypothetical protein